MLLRAIFAEKYGVVMHFVVKVRLFWWILLVWRWYNNKWLIALWLKMNNPWATMWWQVCEWQRTSLLVWLMTGSFSQFVSSWRVLKGLWLAGSASTPCLINSSTSLDSSISIMIGCTPAATTMHTLTPTPPRMPKKTCSTDWHCCACSWLSWWCIH